MGVSHILSLCHLALACLWSSTSLAEVSLHQDVTLFFVPHGFDRNSAFSDARIALHTLSVLIRLVHLFSPPWFPTPLRPVPETVSSLSRTSRPSPASRCFRPSRLARLRPLYLLSRYTSFMPSCGF